MSMINQEDSDEPETFAGSKRKCLQNSEGSIKRAKPISTHHIKQEEVCEEEPIEAETGLGSNDPRIRVKQEVPDAQQGLIHQQENVMKTRSVIWSEMPENHANRITGARISRSEEESNNGSKPKRVKKEVAECELISVQHVRPQNLEDGDFNIEPDWLLVGSTFVTAVSTSKGMKLLDNEIVHLSFPSSNSSYQTQWIDRFSTKRSGEEGFFNLCKHFHRGGNHKISTATLMARGEILADAMGLRKTVITIALILARPGKRGSSDIKITKKRKIDSDTTASLKPRGGTLVVCPLSLLSQWKNEPETHSEPESTSIFVHYGGHRTANPKAISAHDVVMTTYGVLHGCSLQKLWGGQPFPPG